MTSPFERGRIDCIQDSNENAPFGSVGGLDSRADLKCPHYIGGSDWPSYREGYESQARAMYGKDWRTAAFGWVPAILLQAKAPTDRQLFDAISNLHPTWSHQDIIIEMDARAKPRPHLPTCRCDDCHAMREGQT